MSQLIQDTRVDTQAHAAYLELQWYLRQLQVIRTDTKFNTDIWLSVTQKDPSDQRVEILEKLKEIQLIAYACCMENIDTPCE